MRLKSFDNYLISVWSAVALVCIYMLYGPSLHSLNSKEIKVAQILEQLKTVKRKKDFYQGWMDVKEGDGLSLNDEIYTHGQSSAKIAFDHGPEINLFENSLLRIKNLKGQNTLSLDKGNLTAKLTKDSPNLDIELNGKKYSFNSQNASIQIEKGSLENKFLLLDGKAKLLNQEILTNQVVIQNIKTGELKVKEIPFIPKAPAQNLTEYFVKEAQIHFSWTNTKETPAAHLIVARDSQFKNLVTDDAVDGNSLEQTFNEAGTYYWKVTSSEDGDGPIKSFNLIEEIPLTLSSDKTVLYQGAKTPQVFLDWEKQNAKNFLMKIESPNKKVEEINVSVNHYEFSPTVLGEYKISAKINENGRPLALWSHPITISFNEAQSIALTSITPDLLEKVNYGSLPITQMLAWNGPAGISYKITVTKDKTPQEFSTEATSLPINLKDAGAYEWEVAGMTPSGALSNKIAGKIILKVPLRLTQTPSEGAVVELEKPDQLVAFKWDKVNEATHYQFELSNDPSFTSVIVDRDVEANNVSTSLAEIGKYYWRVKIKKGETIEYSKPVSVEIRPAPPLERPDISPDIKIKLKYLEEKSSTFNLIDLFISKTYADDKVIIAEWDLPANQKAKSYIVEIYKDIELKNLVERIETTIPHVVWKNAAAGEFYWRVAYTDFWGRKTDFSKAALLSTEDIEVPKPEPIEIELLNPKHRAEILKEESSLEVLSWKPIPEGKTYQVYIARDLEFTNVILKKTVTTNEFKISCLEFDKREGTYYWKVISHDDASKRRAFSITCAAPPPPPVPPVAVQEPVAPKIEEQAKPAVTQVKTPALKKNYHFLKLGITPHKLAYQNKSSQYNAKVDGNVLDSWFFTYSKNLNLAFFPILSPNLEVARGKVFKEMTFTDIDFTLKAKRLESSFSWGPMISFAKKTLYKEVNLAIADENLSTPLAGLFIQKNLGQMNLNAEAKFGQMLNYRASIEYQMKNNFAFGAFFDSSSITKDESKHTFTQYGLNLNYTFDFLDTTK